MKVKIKNIKKRKRFIKSQQRPSRKWFLKYDNDIPIMYRKVNK